ncbi:hypothetical protein FA95DRAFT_1613338 [Auriscalpium vulgare]|uniref:Uncharacterized protein n=1 Tax=Auriscalpium vulgare TaxID=40419 RepID=A0ACB8R3N8_9AGAM|nr:hypothetical protein FA95DRAFT_1613338 [Auriscalpium vulgare]
METHWNTIDSCPHAWAWNIVAGLATLPVYMDPNDLVIDMAALRASADMVYSTVDEHEITRSPRLLVRHNISVLLVINGIRQPLQPSTPGAPGIFIGLVPANEERTWPPLERVVATPTAHSHGTCSYLGIYRLLPLQYTLTYGQYMQLPPATRRHYESTRLYRDRVEGFCILGWNPANELVMYPALKLWQMIPGVVESAAWAKDL